MEIDLLAERLDSIRQEAQSYQPPALTTDLLEALDADGQEIRIRAVVYLHQLSKGVEELLVKDPRFPASEVKMIRQLNGASGLYPHFVGQKLVQRTLESGSAALAIGWLQKVLGTSKASGAHIAALWNVPVSARVQLTSSIALVPFEQLPESKQKKDLEAQQFQSGAVHTSLDWQIPTAALVVPYVVDPFVSPPDLPPSTDLSEILAQVEEAIHMLTLIGPRVPILSANWFNFDDPDLEFALLGVGRGASLLEILPRHFGQPFPEVDAEEAQRVTRQFASLNPQTKKKITTATARLGQALSRHRAGDRAVELSIALETLLGDAQTNEMTHKVSVRAVRLLGGTSDARARNLQILKRTYAIRSKLVHQGEHEAKPQSIASVEMSVEDMISEACALCATLIKTVIARGAIPSWSQFDISEAGDVPGDPPHTL